MIEPFGGWDRLVETITGALTDSGTPSITALAEENRDPYRVLAGTIISLRTKDAVTLEASEKLFEAAPDLSALSTLTEETIAELIYPAGFYRVKARQLKKIALLLKEKGVPPEREALLALPGVGIKTANLVLGLAFRIPAVCVDIHVHRISNRLGLINTSSPEESEKALEKILPERLWIGINTLLVAFGQQICTPVSPWCSRCPLSGPCPKISVPRSR
jgi:endonuclease III